MNKLGELITKYPKVFVAAPRHSFSCFGFECGDGWYAILDRLAAKLEAENWRGEILQIKEKFGALRVYLSGENEKVSAAISVAEAESTKTCEDCGGPAKLRSSISGWLMTYCDPCIEKRNETRKSKIQFKP